MFAGSQCLDAEALAEVHRRPSPTPARSPTRSACRCRSSTSAAASTSPAAPATSRSTSTALPRRSTIRCATRRRCSRPRAITIELGRWIVGESGVYLTRVLDRTESHGHTFLTTDGGGHHLIGATGSLGERGAVNFPIAVANRFGEPGEEDVTVTGCLCTPFDVLGEDVSLPARRGRRSDRGLLRRRLWPKRQPAGVGKPPARRARCSSRGRSPRRNRGRAAAH